MGARDLLAQLAGAGLRVTTDGERLLVQPASKLTDALRAAVRGAKPELLALVARDAAPATVPDAALPRTWADADIASYQVRQARLMRWGWSEADAELLAERLVIRHRSGDTRVACVDCRNFRPWRCGNHRLAGLHLADVGRDLASLPQRCAGFQPIPC
jgi:TubC N-terminal docking domain